MCVCMWNCGIHAHDDCDFVADNDEYVVLVCVCGNHADLKDENGT